MSPTGQPQIPCKHVSPSGHFTPQAPQLFESHKISVSHPSPTRSLQSAVCISGMHVMRHSPDWQNQSAPKMRRISRPRGQTTPQAPQLSLSVSRFVSQGNESSEHVVYGAGHVVALQRERSALASGSAPASEAREGAVLSSPSAGKTPTTGARLQQRSATQAAKGTTSALRCPMAPKYPSGRVWSIDRSDSSSGAPRGNFSTWTTSEFPPRDT